MNSNSLWTRRNVLKTALGGLATNILGCSSKQVPEGLHSQGSGTGIFYDLKAAEHTMLGHPESQARLEYLLSDKDAIEIFKRASFRWAAPASRGLVTKYHGEALVNKIRRADQTYLSSKKRSPYLTDKSLDVALRSVGGMIQLSEEVTQGWLRNGFAILRPPGHMVGPTEARGFGLFNSVAISTQLMLERVRVEKVAIIDLSAQHGTGTQEFFYSNPNVLFVSVHQKSLNSKVGRIEQVGEGEARGTNVNIPVPNKTGDLGYRLLMESIIAPSIKKFEPNIILVSMGYDSHWREFSTDLGVSSQGFQYLDSQLMSLAKTYCKGQIIYCLESGQNVQVLAEGVKNSMQSLLRRKKRWDSFGKSPENEPDLSRLASRLRNLHSI